MKYGVPVFSYSQPGEVASTCGRRHVSIIVGDNMQTLAVRSLYRRLGIADERVVAVVATRFSPMPGSRWRWS